MSKFCSLRVFHVLRRNNNWEWEPSQLLDLIYLTYLASNIAIIPTTISKFENLQTLIIYRSEVVLPVEIWELRQLRHLMALSFESLPQPNSATLPLENLQQMSLVIDLICGQGMMEMIPNIKKLGICFRFVMEVLNINNLGFLKQLEKLKLVSLEKLQYDSFPIFPPSLKKLTLYGLRLPWEDMRIVGSLPNLQVLKLRNYACDGTFWETTEGESKQLELLMVDKSCLIEWVTKCSHFPKLKFLVLHRCPCLRLIPRDVGNISTLELINVDALNKSLVESAKRIQKNQEKNGIYNIQVCYSNVFLTQQRESAKDVAGQEEDPIPSNSPYFDSFLYMAAFPKNYEIRVSEIIKLWAAEGLMIHEFMEHCLEHLIARRLLLVTSRKADGKIKSFRLCNTVQDFCARKAIEHKFILPLMDYFPRTTVRSLNFPRISSSWYDLEDLNDSIHSSCTQTIICIPQEGYRPKGSTRDFTSLRILHVLCRNDCSYWELSEVFDHIHLTYLASNIPSSIVPPAISKLQNLQTLIIYRHGVCLPVEIWKMRQLRHLMAFSFRPLPDPEDARLPLETLSLTTEVVCSQRMMLMIPDAKKLGLRYSGENVENVEELKQEMSRPFWESLPFFPQSSKKLNLSGSYHLKNLEMLCGLEKLKLEMPASFWGSRPVFPKSLKKLNLSGGGLRWRDVKIIGSLPNLQVLKLRNFACHGKEWKTKDGEFRQLRFLLIDKSNLQHWKIQSRSFPRLKCLMLHRCPYLSEIPSQIRRLLKLIEVDDDNRSLLGSAKNLQEMYGTDRLEVRVKHF